MLNRQRRATRKILVCSTLTFSAFLLILSFSSWRSAASRQNTATTSRQHSLASALNPDGSLRAGASGSFDASGFRMEYSATGAPHFVPASCNGWDTQFSLSNGVNSYVTALAVSGTDIYVGGQFLAAGNVTTNGVARFNTLTNTWSVLGTGGGNGVEGSVYALAVSGSDLYVGGGFVRANVGGTEVNANYVAKFNMTTGVWSALGTGGGNGVSAGEVRALVVSGSDLYVGGYFSTANVGGTTVGVSNLAKYNTTTGVWSALGTGGGNGVSANVYALAVSGSDLYVGGYFTTANIGGTTISANRVAKVNTATGVWSALGTGGGNGVNSVVYALALSGSDLYVGGEFSTANVGGTTVNANFLAKVNTATGVWSATGTNSGYVYALSVSGSDLYVGGDFSGYVTKYNTATGVWSPLGTGGDGVDGAVRALALGGSDLYVGGEFSTANVGGTTVNANYVAKFNITTSVWSALGAGGNGVSAGVNALAVIGSNLYVGGDFTTAGNVTVNYVARFNTLTNTWSALGTGGGNGLNGGVLALAVSGNDLYVGGGFTTANVGGTTVSANRVAKFNTLTNTWSALGTGSGNGVDSLVYALAVSGSDLYVGGFFSTANVGGAEVSVNNVTKVNTTTGIWSALGTGGGNGVNGDVSATNAIVFALAVSGSNLYVGGNLTTANVGGTEVSVNNVAKYNTTTGVWSALGNGGGNGVNYNGVRGIVAALAVSGSDLYVGGAFTTANIGGTTVSVNSIAKYNTTTGTWSALGTGGGNGIADVGISGFVSDLTLSGGDLYVGGYFIRANVGGPEINANYVAKVNTTTGVWSALADTGGGNGVDSSIVAPTVNALALSGSDVFVGGAFTIAGDNKISQYFGRYCGLTPANSPPTIMAGSATRQQGSPAGAAVTIANVSDDITAAGSITVAATTVPAGITLTGISNSGGTITATVAAGCTAALGDNTVVLTATDGNGAMATANFIVTVTANTPPTLGNYPSAGTINAGTGATVTPSAAPSDNGTLSSLNASAPGFTGTFSGNPTTGVITISNAGPGGSYTVTVTATDNCGVTATRIFSLIVDNSLNCVTNPIVANNSDNLAGSLRQAIANACVGSTISFAANVRDNQSGAITLASELVINKNLTIQGPGANVLTISGNNVTRVCYIPYSSVVTIDGLKITQGNGVGAIITGSGGGIFNDQGNLTLTNSTVTGNTANGGGQAGGIYNRNGTLAISRSTISNNSSFYYAGGVFNDGSNAVFTMTDSTVSGNSTGGYRGGGIVNVAGQATLTNITVSGNTSNGQGAGGLWNWIGGTLTMTNCTVSGNTGNGYSGGILNDGSTLTLTNCTVSGNRDVSSNASWIAGGIGNYSGPVTIKNTLVANNTINASNSPSDCAGTITSQGFNLIKDISGATITPAQTTDIFGLDPLLGPLANNGGLTQTMALLPGSPAIDKGGAVSGLSTDQRGQTRPRDYPAIANATGGNGSDIGAFEVQNLAPTITAAGALTRQQGSAAGAAVTVANVSDAEDSAGTLSVAVIAGGTATGITLGPLVNTNGMITATVAASCTATAGTVRLQVTDSVGLTATSDLQVNVALNTPPALGSYPLAVTINAGAGTTVAPSAAPSDNGVLNSITASAPGFTGSFNVDSTTGVVTISNANPPDSYTVTVTATDNCGATTTATFTLNVSCANTPIVANNADSGADSLRQAIANACVGSTITFANTVTSPITLASELVINKNLTIQGPGATLLSVSGNNVTRVFYITAATVTINGLTITQGNAVGAPASYVNSGAGILNEGGSLNLINSIVSDNSTPVGGEGGGILNVDGTLAISNSTIRNNACSNYGSGIYNWAIHSDAILTLTDSTVANNNSRAFRGAGIVNYGGHATLTNSTISGNNSTGQGAGGILNWVGGLTLINSTVSGNTGSYNNGGEIFGGGILNNYGGTVMLVNSTVSGNSENNAPGGWDPLESTCRHASLSIL